MVFFSLIYFPSYLVIRKDNADLIKKKENQIHSGQ